MLILFLYQIIQNKYFSHTNLAFHVIYHLNKASNY